MEKTAWEEHLIELLVRFFPKGACHERGNALALVASLTHLLTQEGLLQEGIANPATACDDGPTTN